jgi:hypothetical protein
MTTPTLLLRLCSFFVNVCFCLFRQGLITECGKVVSASWTPTKTFVAGMALVQIKV